MNIGVILCAIVVVGAFFVWMTEHEKKKAEAEKVNQAHKIFGEQLESTYRLALLSNDKSKALEAGRAYYGHLRGGSLTIYDEQALSNDLSAMKAN
ncbi:hypothetical protein [Fibrella forsythiae]|uniref:Uncharacterized protein n=1 Tax=Fibrella forsythiae TaxID=2817061 RepID=A0ABS3JBK0_9BACT|nr:hypothetical protein [Fibrella forsythiae]MBO0947358.1 hypothetical protein [Fibrella forsythiae]